MRQAHPDFATVLKEAEAASSADEIVHRPPIHPAFAVFPSGFSEPASAPRPRDPAPLFDLEAMETDADRLERERREIVGRMRNQSPDAIRQELELRPGLKRAALQRLRRSFAARNHPDRLPEEFRPAAEQRMKTANALLDAAMASAPNKRQEISLRF